MSVVINTNFAATLASNNLAASSQMLQKSLNRLSSGSKIVNPSDDAGGLAVSMKLSTAAKRQAALGDNIANAISLLQTQDGVLHATAKVLNRISELKVLNGDVTKSASDKANYQAEFASLQSQLTANGAETFNGVSLFGSSGLSVATTEDGTHSVAVQGIELLSTTGGSAVTINLSNSAYQPFTPSGAGTLTYNGATFLDFGETGTSILDPGQSATYDGAGNWSLPPTNGNIDMTGYTTVTLMAGAPGETATFTPSGGNTNTGTVAAASGLSSLSLSTISSAIADVATYRAQNGANQSRLGFASELLATNKANLEAATSRITDVDVAAESTSLARYNILVQAGTAMLSQANQSTQMTLKLLG